MDWLNRLFSAGADASRLNAAGLALMFIAVLTVAFAGKFAAKIRPAEPQRMKNAIKIIGLIICAGGALLAILG